MRASAVDHSSTAFAQDCREDWPAIAKYDRLTASGKAHKATLIACVRKLLIYANTVVQRGTPWIENAA
jgi:hypothetical protein